MKFEFEVTNTEENSGALIITAETPTEVSELLKHEGFMKGDLSPDEMIANAERIKSGIFAVRKEPRKTASGFYRWFRVECSLPKEFADEYVKLVNRRTGMNINKLPDMELESSVLNYTFHIERVWIENGVIKCVAYKDSHEWNGMTAEKYAHHLVNDYFREYYGARKHEREFIENRSGTYSMNPNYLKRHAPHPAASAEGLKQKLFDWWVRCVANEAQQEIIRSAVECHDNNRTPLKGFDAYAIHYNDWKSCINWVDLINVKDEVKS